MYVVFLPKSTFWVELWNNFYTYPENHEGGWFSPLPYRIFMHDFYSDTYVSFYYILMFEKSVVLEISKNNHFSLFSNFLASSAPKNVSF